MSIPTSVTGVILMTYGSATTSADVSEFLHHVYPRPSRDLIDEFARRFEVIGGSPLVEITLEQAKELQDELNARVGTGAFVVEAGLLHSAPFIDQAMERLASTNVTRVVGLLLSPQYSPHIMRGYDEALAAASQRHGFTQGSVSMLGPWPTAPKFIELTSRRLQETLANLRGKYESPIPVVFTTHSLPESVVKRDPSYLDQLQETIQAVVDRTNLQQGEWHSAYQSAGHTPEPWLKPDLNDVIAELKPGGTQAVVIVPIQFLADHLEILYDLDTAAREETEALGVAYHRLPVPNTAPLFIQALADIVLS
jgi:ferrochelatase